MKDYKEITGCSSILLHVSENESVISFRRDSPRPVPLYIKNGDWYGNTVIKEYKTETTYFFHTIITDDGWVIGSGGAQQPFHSTAIEVIIKHIIENNNITTKEMDQVNALFKEVGFGHLVVKSPKGQIGVAIYFKDSKNNENITSYVNKIKPGEFVCVPNHPKYYFTEKYEKYEKNPVKASIKIAGLDTWGDNRRNIITYHHKSNQENKVNIYVSYDNGYYLDHEDNGGGKDTIFINGKEIKKIDIPTLPDKKHIGQIDFEKLDKTNLNNIE
ncbi:MAG: hypothetical protein Q4Q23_00940 [Methanobacteriaceae archaeon]|nr:hypothetical protein [Methanobacteriaceae archaeon]